MSSYRSRPETHNLPWWCVLHALHCKVQVLQFLWVGLRGQRPNSRALCSVCGLAEQSLQERTRSVVCLSTGEVTWVTAVLRSHESCKSQAVAKVYLDWHKSWTFLEKKYAKLFSRLCFPGLCFMLTAAAMECEISLGSVCVPCPHAWQEPRTSLCCV